MFLVFVPCFWPGCVQDAKVSSALCLSVSVCRHCVFLSSVSHFAFNPQVHYFQMSQDKFSSAHLMLHTYEIKQLPQG